MTDADRLTAITAKLDEELADAEANERGYWDALKRRQADADEARTRWSQSNDMVRRLKSIRDVLADAPEAKLSVVA